MNIVDLKFVPQGTPDLNIQAFDCGRKSVNDFFHNEAQDYQDELFGKTYYFCLPDSPSDIVAGFTVANASISPSGCPMPDRRRLAARYTMRKDSSTIPLFYLLSWVLI